MSTEPPPRAVRHPVFARVYARLSQAMEREVADHRRDLLTRLAGRVIEVGAPAADRPARARRRAAPRSRGRRRGDRWLS